MPPCASPKAAKSGYQKWSVALEVIKRSLKEHGGTLVVKAVIEGGCQKRPPKQNAAAQKKRSPKAAAQTKSGHQRRSPKCIWPRYILLDPIYDIHPRYYKRLLEFRRFSILVPYPRLERSRNPDVDTAIPSHIFASHSSKGCSRSLSFQNSSIVLND